MFERVTPRLEAILNEARDLTEGKAHHANAVRVITTDTNIYLDFYQVMPDPTQPSDQTAERIERVVLPINPGKTLTHILAHNDTLAETGSIAPKVIIAETDDDQIDSSDETWGQIEGLYGAWSHLDAEEGDEFFEGLRSGNRMKALYGDE